MPNEAGAPKKPTGPLTGVKVKTRKGISVADDERVVNHAAVADLVEVGPDPQQIDDALLARQTKQRKSSTGGSTGAAPEQPAPGAGSVHELLSDLADGADSIRLLTEETITAALAVPAHEDLIGRTIDGRYEVLERLGEGGSGIVYKARHTVFERLVALKVLHPRLASDERALRRFLQEARTVVRLRHPNAISVHEFGVVGHVPYLVMEFVEGRRLTEVILQDGPLSLERSHEFLKQACAALSCAHNMGIVHRDLKPDNIMITRQPDGTEQVQVLDFGIAKLLNANPEAAHITREGVPCGTPHYMSPEQVLAHELDQRSDLYSLGIILYEMLTGTAPFSEYSPIEVMFKQIHSVPTPPSEFKPELNIPPGVEAIIARLLEKDADKRFQTADELVAAFAEHIAEPPPSAHSLKLRRAVSRVRRQGLAGVWSVICERRRVVLASIVALSSVLAMEYRDDLRIFFGAPLLEVEHSLGISLRPVKMLLGLDVTFSNNDLIRHVEADELLPVQLLLRAGLRPDVRTSDGTPLLHVAITHGDGSMLAELLGARADVSIRDSAGRSPLMRAAEENRVPMIYSLLERDAQLEALDDSGRTALMRAIAANAETSVRALLDIGASVHRADKRDLTPLMYAVSRGNPYVVELLLNRGAEVNARGPRRETALIQAAASGESAIAEMLVKRGADVRLDDEQGVTPLMVAVNQNNAATVALLLSAGADAAIADNEGKSARDRVTMSTPEVVRNLLGVR